MPSNSYNSSKGYAFDRPPEMRKKVVPFSTFWLGILSVVFTAVVGAFMLADSYVLLEDRRKALVLRAGFLGGILLWWFSLTAIALLISPASDSIVLSVGTTLLAWFAPLLPLRVQYRRWHDEWVAMNGEITNRKGAGSGFFYSFMMIVVTFLYHTIAPPIAAKAILGTSYYDVSFTTFEDGSFSMSYPEYWATTQDTANPACYSSSFECVENFILPSFGLLSIARISTLEPIASLSQEEQLVWENIVYSQQTSVKVFDTSLDAFEAVQRDFIVENKGKKGEGIVLVSITDTELYIIVGVSDKENFYQIEDAISTIQLDAVSNSQ